MILPPKQNPSHMRIFFSIVAAGEGHDIEATWESTPLQR